MSAAQVSRDLRVPKSTLTRWSQLTRFQDAVEVERHRVLHDIRNLASSYLLHSIRLLDRVVTDEREPMAYRLVAARLALQCIEREEPKSLFLLSPPEPDPLVPGTPQEREEFTRAVKQILDLVVPDASESTGHRLT